MKVDLQPFPIKTLYAAIAVGEGEQAGHEGIFGVMEDGVWMPIVFSSPSKFGRHKLMLQAMAAVAGVKVELRTYKLDEEGKL